MFLGLGLSQYKVFRVPMPDRWVVVVSGADMNEELRKLPDTHVSLAQAVNEVTPTPRVVMFLFYYGPSLTMCLRNVIVYSL